MCVCLWVYRSICVCLYMCRCVCVCMWRPGHSLGYHPQELYLLGGSLSLAWWSPVNKLAGWGPPGPSCLYLPSATVTSTCCHSGILCGLGDWTGPQACKANTFPTDCFPSLQLNSILFSSPQYWEMNLWLCACWAIACPLNYIPALYVSHEERFSYVSHSFWDNIPLANKTE